MREYTSVRVIQLPELGGYDDCRTIHLEFTGSVENESMWLDPTIVAWEELTPDDTTNISKEALGILIGPELVKSLEVEALTDLIEQWSYGD